MARVHVTGGYLNVQGFGGEYPDQGLPGSPAYPDQGLPGDQPGIDNALPEPPPGIWPPPSLGNPDRADWPGQHLASAAWDDLALARTPTTRQ